MKDTNIEWADHTVNLWWGCSKVHPGCDHCYAEVLSKKYKNDLWGINKLRKIISGAGKALNTYQHLAAQKNIRSRVFIGSMMDIFERPMPLINHKKQHVRDHTGELRSKLFDEIDSGLYPNLDFLFLTKRPSNINRMIPERWVLRPPENVMFGASPVDQDTFDNFAYHMEGVNGKKFLSIEPQLGPVTLPPHFYQEIDWIIQGGESGKNKRPFDLAWAYSLRDQCREQDIPYFFKQIDKVKQIPDDLLIREFPREPIPDLI